MSPFPASALHRVLEPMPTNFRLFVAAPPFWYQLMSLLFLAALTKLPQMRHSVITSYLLSALWASGGGWPERRSFLSASLGVTQTTASAGGRLGLDGLLASSHAWAPGPLSTWSLVLHEASLGFFPRAASSEEGKRGNFRAPPGLGPEVRQRHFCSILLVKASHEAGPDSRGRDIHFMAQWEVDEVLLQRGVYDRMGEKSQPFL